MKINDKIVEFLKDSKVDVDDGICYLLSLYYGLSPSYIPAYVKIEINLLGLFNVDSHRDIHWKIPLFEEQMTNFEWVKTEYVPLFKEANPDRGGHVRESVKRLKKIFTDYPEIRKDDVIGAVKLYLNNTDFRYIRFPHYFISKGKGLNMTFDLLTWIDKYKELENIQVTSNTRRLQ